MGVCVSIETQDVLGKLCGHDNTIMISKNLRELNCGGKLKEVVEPPSVAELRGMIDKGLLPLFIEDVDELKGALGVAYEYHKLELIGETLAPSRKLSSVLNECDVLPPPTWPKNFVMMVNDWKSCEKVGPPTGTLSLHYTLNGNFLREAIRTTVKVRRVIAKKVEHVESVPFEYSVLPARILVLGKPDSHLGSIEKYLPSGIRRVITVYHPAVLAVAECDHAELVFLDSVLRLPLKIFNNSNNRTIQFIKETSYELNEDSLGKMIVLKPYIGSSKKAENVEYLRALRGEDFEVPQAKAQMSKWACITSNSIKRIRIVKENDLPIVFLLQYMLINVDLIGSNIWVFVDVWREVLGERVRFFTHPVSRLRIKMKGEEFVVVPSGARNGSELNANSGPAFHVSVA